MEIGSFCSSREISKTWESNSRLIPCGIDGDGEAYAPSDKVLRRLKDQGVAVYRSDTNGNIVIESSLEGLNVKTEK